MTKNTFTNYICHFGYRRKREPTSKEEIETLNILMNNDTVTINVHKVDIKHVLVGDRYQQSTTFNIRHSRCSIVSCRERHTGFYYRYSIVLVSWNPEAQNYGRLDE